ncbi:MAG: VOC family protein [Candidatus Oceanisphaera merdipullorum]|nr:VOC family protein [Candidatus Oceanisphaera merdipullorum]
MKTNAVVWFEIYVNDMARARAFYEAVLQVTLEPAEKIAENWPELWMFPGENNASGASGALVRMVGDEESTGGGSTLVYFNCADCAEQISRVSEHGGRVIRDKFAIGPYGFIAIAMDTEGNRIGLHSMR